MDLIASDKTTQIKVEKGAALSKHSCICSVMWCTEVLKEKAGRGRNLSGAFNNDSYIFIFYEEIKL